MSNTFLATAISRVDNLEFLSDAVPKTKTYRQFREEKAQEAATKTNGVNDEMGPLEAMMKNQAQNGTTVDGVTNGSTHQRTSSHPDPIRDIEMQD
jgi:hypothetical protein